MPTSKFDLVRNLPKQSQKMERLASIESCKNVVEQYNTMRDRCAATDPEQQQTGGADGSDNERVSESNSSQPICQSPKVNKSKKAPDTFSQDGIDRNQNAKRKTVILLQTPAEHDKHDSDGPVLNSKGYSRTAQLSVLYAAMLGLVGIVFPITEALNDQWLSSHIVGVFLTYLFVCASVFILYIEIHDVVLKKGHKNARKLREIGDIGIDNHAIEAADVSETDSDMFPDIVDHGDEADNTSVDLPSGQAIAESSHVKDIAKAPRDSARSVYGVDSDLADDVYDYITMHHKTSTIASFDTNYFLKSGLLLFAVANMVYIALRIEGEHYRNSCSGLSRIIYPHYVHLAFIVLQTFFLTKECKLALRKHKALVNFGLMHLAATNLCIWFRYLVTEVGESAHEADEANGHSYFTANPVENITTNSCLAQPAMVKAGPYLFPFILEYSLIAMTTLIVVYGNINIQVTRELYRSICKALDKKRLDTAKCDANYKSETKDDVHGAFDKSHKGLTLGGVVLAGVIVSMVLFFYWKGIGEERKAQLCYTISEIILLALIAINTVVGMYRLFNFIYNSADSNTLDHALLLISANFLLVMELFALLSVIFHIADSGADGLLVAEVMEPIISIIQAILQVAFINDGMQRVSVKDEHVRQKKGRGIITFLIVLNATMWLFESFQEKKSDQTEEIEMYGSMAWAIIDSLAHPLELFFYFHSAICLSHMWHHCYKKPEHNVLGDNLLL